MHKHSYTLQKNKDIMLALIQTTTIIFVKYYKVYCTTKEAMNLANCVVIAVEHFSQFNQIILQIHVAREKIIIIIIII